MSMVNVLSSSMLRIHAFFTNNSEVRFSGPYGAAPCIEFCSASSCKSQGMADVDVHRW